MQVLEKVFKQDLLQDHFFRSYFFIIPFYEANVTVSYFYSRDITVTKATTTCIKIRRFQKMLFLTGNVVGNDWRRGAGQRVGRSGWQ